MWLSIVSLVFGVSAVQYQIDFNDSSRLIFLQCNLHVWSYKLCLLTTLNKAFFYSAHFCHSNFSALDAFIIIIINIIYVRFLKGFFVLIFVLFFCLFVLSKYSRISLVIKL